MIQKIKELMRIKEQIDEITKTTNSYNETIGSLKKEISELKNEISSLSSSQSQLLNTLRTDLSEISNLKEQLKKEIYDFNLLKSQLQAKILEKFEDRLERELKLNLDRFKAENIQYDEAKKEIAVVIKNTSLLAEYLNKFIEIGKNIKKEDFELSRFANEIWKSDREKLELMKKIDTMERLIGQMRRSGGR